MKELCLLIVSFNEEQMKVLFLLMLTVSLNEEQMKALFQLMYYYYFC